VTASAQPFFWSSVPSPRRIGFSPSADSAIRPSHDVPLSANLVATSSRSSIPLDDPKLPRLEPETRHAREARRLLAGARSPTRVGHDRRLTAGLPQVANCRCADAGDVGDKGAICRLAAPPVLLREEVLEQTQECFAVFVADPHEGTFRVIVGRRRNGE
jgi:hypothetical protein